MTSVTGALMGRLVERLVIMASMGRSKRDDERPRKVGFGFQRFLRENETRLDDLIMDIVVNSRTVLGTWEDGGAIIQEKRY